jgi:hypothetical protein
MNMPGMAGEASVYKTNNNYRSTAGGGSPNNWNITVTPQGCGITEILTCGAFVAVAGTVCVGACIAGPFTCLGCVLGVFGPGLLITCHDCLPESIRTQIDIARSGGDGGPPPPIPCCPGNRRCCGSCVPLPNGRGMQCDDACIGPGQHCP